MNARWSVGIIGAGRMAQGFDAPGAGPVRTLAHAVERSSSFTLGGFFDTDAGRARAAEERWSCRPSPRDRAAWFRAGWDAIFIATPDERHGEDLADALTARPRAILVEKPPALDADRGRELLDEAARLRVPVLVDYPRRWHTAVADVAGLVAAGSLGGPCQAILAYTGAARHSAIHGIDLLHGWLGAGWRVIGRSDRGAGAMVRLERNGAELEIVFVRVRTETYYLWEVHLYFDRGKIELSQSPERLTVFGAGTHPAYRTHTVLAQRNVYEMETEPLLERTLAELASLIADPASAARHARREIESQSLAADLLRGID